MTTIYGIQNCDTIKKARNYLEQHHIDYTFHDYRRDGLTEQQLVIWVAELGWESLVNKRSTTWRQLPASLKNTLDESMAIKVMLDNPTVIKRPLLEQNECIYLGFSVAGYNEIFQQC